jgi:protein transport protein SEC13
MVLTSPMKLMSYVYVTVNSVSWAPHEFGLMIACGSSDGSVSILSNSGSGHWDAKKIVNAHTVNITK